MALPRVQWPGRREVSPVIDLALMLIVILGCVLELQAHNISGQAGDQVRLSIFAHVLLIVIEWRAGLAMTVATLTFLLIRSGIGAKLMRWDRSPSRYTQSSVGEYRRRCLGGATGARHAPGPLDAATRGRGRE